MKSLQKQNGIGMINLIIIIMIVAFLANFAIKIVPMYVDNRMVITGLKSLAEPGNNLNQMSDAEIKKKMFNFFLINNVASEDAKKIVIEHKADSLIIKSDYETRANLFANIDLVMSFRNHLDSTRPTECCKPLDEK